MSFASKFCHQAPPFFNVKYTSSHILLHVKMLLKTNYVDHWVKAYCSLRSEIKLSPPDKVNLLLTNRGSTVAFNATFVPRSSIVFISDFDRTIFFPMTHGASSRLNVAEGFYRSGWLPVPRSSFWSALVHLKLSLWFPHTHSTSIQPRLCQKQRHPFAKSKRLPCAW